MPNSLQAGDAVPLRCVQAIRPPVRSIGQGKQTLEFVSLSPAWHVTFSVDGKWMAVCFGAPDCCIRLYQQGMDDNWVLAATLDGIHTRTIRCVAFAPLHTEYCVLASASFDGTVAIYEHTSPQDRSSMPSADDWECTAQLEGHDNEVKCVAWNATSTLLSTCGRDKSVWVWECALPGQIAGNESEWECLSVLHGHEGDVKCVVFAPSHQQWGDGDEILLSSGYDGKICVWAEDAGDWYCASTLQDKTTGIPPTITVWSLALAPGGVRLMSAMGDGTIQIYKAYSREEKKNLPDYEDGSNGMWKCVGRLPHAHQGEVYSVAYAPTKAGHGRWASCGADGVLQIYREAMTSSSDAPKFFLESAATAPQQSLTEWNHVTWHPFDGSILATVGDDGVVRIWNYGK